MLKRSLMMLALAVPLVPAAAMQTAPQTSPAPAPAMPAPAPGQTQAQMIAGGIQSLVGQTFEGGIKISGVTAEANTLVIEITGPAGWRTELSPQAVSDALIAGFCQKGGALFSSGMTMRVDSVDGSAKQAGPVVSSCPAAAPPQ
jgi:hypothetical protein